MIGITPETSLANLTPRQGITLRDIVFVLFRRRWVILAVAIPIIILGGTSLFQQTGSFIASSTVVVELAKVDLPQWNTMGRNIDYDRELSTLYNIAMSVPVGEQAALTLQDSIAIIQSLDPSLIGLEEKGGLSNFLLGGLDVSVVGESSILEFRFSSVHPRISLMAAGALRDAFVEYQVHGRKNLDAVAYYEEQVTGVRAEIDSLLAKRAVTLRSFGYSSLQDELRYDSGLLADIESKLIHAAVVCDALEMEHGRLSHFLGEDPRDFPMGPDENRSHSLVYWRTLVGQHDDELNSILTIHTEKSIAARRQRGLIDDSLANLHREQETYVRSIGITLASARKTEESLRHQVSEIQAKNSTAPEVYHKVSLLDAEIFSLRSLLEDLQVKRGEVRLSQLADERVSNVVVLTDPELATVLSGGKTMIYFAFIVIFAIALGLVGAFILETLDHRVYVPKDIEEKLQLPVFSSVSRVD